MSTRKLPRRGEIWQANLGDQTPGLVLVVSADAFEHLPIRLVARLRPWEDRFASMVWLQRLEGTWPTRLGKPHAVDLLQLHSIEVHRLHTMVGRAPATAIDEIAAAIALVVDYNPAG